MNAWKISLAFPSHVIYVPMTDFFLILYDEFHDHCQAAASLKQLFRTDFFMRKRVENY